MNFLILLFLGSSFSWSIQKTESVFTSHVNLDRIASTLKLYSAEPHPAGSPNGHLNAQLTLKILSKCHAKSTISTYYPLLNTPVTRSLTLLEPTHYEASLREDVIEQDPSSVHQDDVPTFFGYGPSGNVTSSLVYANFGLPSDFETLKSNGIDVSGKIVLVRYGHTFRGLKVRAAELAGAIGVLVYSDPKEDGYVMGPVYPEGKYRPSSAVQRGSIQYMNFYAGDPLTPGIGATKNAPRLNVSEALTLAKIPALPISYGDAKPFLDALVGHGIKGDSLSPEWQGGLPLEYWTGPAAKVSLIVNNTFEVKPIWDVMGEFKGKLYPDEVIVIGNHIDAWVHGAMDPHSGTASILEVARIFGELIESGWAPDRTILFGFWDAEEYGIVGSTEWVEDHLEFVNRSVVAYLNVDSAVGGTDFLKADSTPALHRLLYQVTKSIKYPSSNHSLFSIWANQSGEMPPRVGGLGFGSDYVSFLNHAGVSCLDIGFSGNQGIYHSNYDSFHWMSTFGDPTWEYHGVITKVIGFLAIRLANEPVVPLRFSEYGRALTRYIGEIKDILDSKGYPHSQEMLDPLYSSAMTLTKIALKLEERIHSLSIDQEFPSQTRLSKGKRAKLIAKINAKLIQAERFFLDQKGMPGRPWYKHVVYSPGQWTGYGSQVFPALQEAISSGNVDSIEYEILNLSVVFDRVSQSLS